ncbi:MAG: Ig-like domain-containing protein [Bacteroidales bacterium]|nr:Ig-like domain-containing protein [Bacteroidales bacterium]
MKKTDLAFGAALTGLLVFSMTFTHSCANTTQAPTGGPKDTIPPVLVGAEPGIGTVGFPVKGGKILLAFDEYVTIKNEKNIFLSPPLAKKPKSRLRGKAVEISFEEELKPNTTYNLSLVNAIADNNEGNMFPGVNFVFSTGDSFDSLMISGTVRDCKNLNPVADATVMLYKDHGDSALFLGRPDAAARTDEYGFFVVPYLKDTLYRLYAIKDEASNNIYDPDVDLVAFADSLVRPATVVSDTLPELQAYDPRDTLGLLARRSEYELLLFREKPTKQYIQDSKRVDRYKAYVKFQAPFAWVDSIWVSGYGKGSVITQFNDYQDSLEIWLNTRKRTPDTMKVNVQYRKTDSLGILKPDFETLRLTVEGESAASKYKKVSKRDLKHEDTICVSTLKVEPETFARDGFRLEFKYPLINADFGKAEFKYVNPKQKEFPAKFRVEPDSRDVRIIRLIPETEPQEGNDYILKIKEGAFRDITGFRSDSLEAKTALPKDDKLSTLRLEITGVEGKHLVEILDEKLSKTLRSEFITSDSTLEFKYMKAGKYAIRFTSDINDNNLVDTGSVLEHRQPEKVRFCKFGGSNAMIIAESAEVEQKVDLQELFGQ